MRKPALRTALIISVLYVLVTTTWHVLFDQFVGARISDPVSHVHFHLAESLALACLTALFLFLLLRRHYLELEERIRERTAALARANERLAVEVRERTLAEQAQRESWNQLNAILQHTHVLAAYLDANFNFVWVNPAYAAAGRQDASFFPGKNHFDLYPHAENQAIFQRVVDTGEPYYAAAKPFEYPDQPERGVTYWDWSLIAVRSAGEVAGLVFTLTEVTSRVQAELALQRAHDELEA